MPLVNMRELDIREGSSNMYQYGEGREDDEGGGGRNLKI